MRLNTTQPATPEVESIQRIQDYVYTDFDIILTHPSNYTMTAFWPTFHRALPPTPIAVPCRVVCITQLGGSC